MRLLREAWDLSSKGFPINVPAKVYTISRKVQLGAEQLPFYFERAVRRYLSTQTLLLCVLLPFLVTLVPKAAAIPFFGKKTKESFSDAPPLPADATVSIDRKQGGVITLRVLGPQQGPVRFIIRSLPTAGSAKLLPQASSEEAYVEYRPPSDRGVTRDSFTFAAANSKGFSSEATVSIRITDRPGKIELPQNLEFPDARVGIESRQTLRLKNSGDSPLKGTVSIPHPWTGGPSHYELEPGEEFTLELALKPTVPGVVKGDLVFSTQPKPPISLYARVEDWIHAGPDPLPLSSIPGSRDRQGKLLLRNAGTENESVLVQTEPPLAHPQRVTVPAGGSAEVTLLSNSIRVEPFSGTLRLTRICDLSPPPQKLLLWIAQTAGPLLRIADTSRQPLSIPLGQPLGLAFSNEGGSEGSWTLSVEPPFLVDTQNLRLPSGKSRDVRIHVPTQVESATAGRLQIKGEGQSIEIALSALPLTPKPSSPSPVTSSQERSTKKPSKAAPSSSQRLTSAPTAAPQPTPAEEKWDLPSFQSNTPAPPTPPIDPETLKLGRVAFSSRTAINGSRLHSITDRSAILDLPLGPEIPPEFLSLQTLTFSENPDQVPPLKWVPMTNVKVTRNPKGIMEVEFFGLEPATTYPIRVIGGMKPDGKRVVLQQLELVTLRKKSMSLWLQIALPALCLGAVLVGIRKLRRV